MMSRSEIIDRIPEEVRNRYQSKGNLLWIAYDCLLIETVNPKSFRYDIINLKTGKTMRLFTQKLQVTPDTYDKVVLKIKDCDIAGNSRHCIDGDKFAKSTVTKDDLEGTLSYVFQTLLPKHGYAVREEQVRLSSHMMEHLHGHKIALSEAEVGTGKSLAYLVAAALIKRSRINHDWAQLQYNIRPQTQMPMVISTSSIALQKALVHEYIPTFSKILMEEGIISSSLKAIIRKGKEHYLCKRRLEKFLNEKANESEKTALELLQRKNAPIDLDENDTLRPYLKSEICVSGQCQRNCKHYKECKYLSFLNRAQSDQYDFQVCNHNYLLADLNHRANHQAPLIPDYQGVIIDEAHKLLPAARSMHEVSISRDSCLCIAERLAQFRFEKGYATAEFQKRTSQFRMETERLFQLLEKDICTENQEEESERFPIPINGKAGGSLVNLRTYLDGITAELTEKPVQSRFQESSTQILRQLEQLRQSICSFKLNRNLVYWLEHPGTHASIHGIPKALPKLLYDQLWNRRMPIILTSGTLSTAGDFQRIKAQLGLDLSGRVSEQSHASPFDYKQNTMLYLSKNTTFPDNQNPDYIASITEEISRLIAATHGHTAVLFTSYRAMELVYQGISKKNLPFPLFKLCRSDLSTLEQFRNAGNGVLFASGSMWEGVDIPGDALSSLIIVRLPFAVPDPISAWEASKYATEKDYKEHIIIPDMLLKLRQGVGRLIRTETDTGIIALLDARMHENNLYRKKVLDALPPCPITSDLKTVGRFILEHKDETYFADQSHLESASA